MTGFSRAAAARGRHELAGVRDRLDVQQDRRRAGIGAETVEQIAEVDVDRVAERDEVREADALLARAIEQCTCQGAGLRHEGERAGQGIGVRKARIESDPRGKQPEAVRAEEAQAAGARGGEHGIDQRRAVCPVLLQSGRDHDRRTCPDRAELGDQTGYGRSRRADDREVRRGRERADAAHGRSVGDAVMTQIDEVHGPREAAAKHVARQRRADAPRSVRGADDGERAGREQVLQIARADAPSYPSAPRRAAPRRRELRPRPRSAPRVPHQRPWRL